jgi:hypothetical protein
MDRNDPKFRRGVEHDAFAAIQSWKDEDAARNLHCRVALQRPCWGGCGYLCQRMVVEAESKRRFPHREIPR